MGPLPPEAFFDRPHAASALLALLEEGELSTTQLGGLAGYVDREAAGRLREDLEAWGLVNVGTATDTGRAGNPGHRIWLTSAGRKVAETLQAIGAPAVRLRALRTLRALMDRSPATTRELVEISRYLPLNAKRLRDDLESWGLVQVETGTVNRTVGHRIALTNAGRKVAEQAAEIARIIERASGKRG